MFQKFGGFKTRTFLMWGNNAHQYHHAAHLVPLFKILQFLQFLYVLGSKLLQLARTF